ncbi:MAG: type 2 isopentenyl-diphosphate Delta-isomerase, partial [Bacteroidetes bacterium]
MDKLESKTPAPLQNDDPTAAERKKDHIELAFRSQVLSGELDDRFYYEPLLSAHPQGAHFEPFSFLGKAMRVPVWVSSMTGGTAEAKTINHNLARACRDFGMGMGLGSCRVLLFEDAMLPDFNVRPIIGDDLPLFANLGIAQLEQLSGQNDWRRVRELLDKLSADGLIIHVNPLQEWLQPEGDRFQKPPLETIQECLEKLDCPLIVKEVGQGMGYRSLRALFELPLAAVDFAANGGTNFARLELLRSDPEKQAIYASLAHVGHSAEEMVDMTNEIVAALGAGLRCREVIISGGIRSFLDGYYLTEKLSLRAVYGQASGFLKYARQDYDTLYNYVKTQMDGLALARAFL